MSLLSAGAVASGQVALNSGNAKADGQFGRAIAGLTDVTGDGRGEIIVGARREGPGTSRMGRAYIFNGATGAIYRVLTSPHPESDGQFGASVAGIADVNGDGCGDVIVGAPDEDPGNAPEDAGRAYIISGRTGAVLSILAAPSQEFEGEFGDAVAGVPDVNGDGRPDVAVGARSMDPGTATENSGRVYLYSGATGAYLRALYTPTATLNGNFGDSLAGVADLNGDGRGDVIVGAPSESWQVANSGLVHLYSGATGVRIRSIPSPRREIGGRFGESVAAVPDVNQDGRADIVVGAPHEDPGSSPQDAGRAYVFSGVTGALLWILYPPAADSADDFGDAVAGLPDLNGDGRGDIAVGAHDADPGTAPSNSGRVHVYSGATGKRLFTLVSPHQADDGRFGSAVAAVPDTNGNGFGDIAVGAEGEGGSPAESGRAYLFHP
ncbi:MAG: FG-GAP-like repeat-containing protein [Phycisphaerales bacterium]